MAVETPVVEGLESDQVEESVLTAEDVPADLLTLAGDHPELVGEALTNAGILDGDVDHSDDPTSPTYDDLMGMASQGIAAPTLQALAASAEEKFRALPNIVDIKTRGLEVPVRMKVYRAIDGAISRVPLTWDAGQKNHDYGRKYLAKAQTPRSDIPRALWGRPVFTLRPPKAAPRGVAKHENTAHGCTFCQKRFYGGRTPNGGMITAQAQCERHMEKTHPAEFRLLRDGEDRNQRRLEVQQNLPLMTALTRVIAGSSSGDTRVAEKAAEAIQEMAELDLPAAPPGMKWVRATEAAKIHGVHVKTLKERSKQGLLPGVKDKSGSFKVLVGETAEV